MISDCKLKVMLCPEDLRHFDMKAEQLDYSNTETKRMFWDILNRAKHQTGFDTDGQRVLVQLYPSKEGGCEMFVTKIGLIDTTDDEKMKVREHSSSKNSHSQKRRALKTGHSIYGFEKTEHMLAVCKRLFSIGYIGESSAYVCNNGRKYLLLSDMAQDINAPLDEFSFITEYGTSENTQILGCYISEHGKAICEREAIATLAKLY